MVVLAIIALAHRYFAPQPRQSQGYMAVRVKCAAVLKQWGEVVSLYEAEWDGTWCIKGIVGGQAWNSTGTSTVSSPYATEWAAKFNSTMRTCPGDPTKANTGATLYSMVRPAPIMSNVVSWRVQQAKFPHSLLIMSDTDAPTGNPWFTSMADQPMVNLKQVLMDRHLGTGNALFLDSHVEAAKYVDFQNNVPASMNGLNVAAGEEGQSSLDSIELIIHGQKRLRRAPTLMCRGAPVAITEVRW